MNIFCNYFFSDIKRLGKNYKILLLRMHKGERYGLILITCFVVLVNFNINTWSYETFDIVRSWIKFVIVVYVYFYNLRNSAVSAVFLGQCVSNFSF